MTEGREEKKITPAKKIWRRLALSFGLVLMFAVGFYLGGEGQAQAGQFDLKSIYASAVGQSDVSMPTNINPSDFDFNEYWQVVELLKQNYVNQDKIVDKDLFYGSLRGLVSSIGDPYTMFMEPKTAKQFESDLSGSFEGIGAEIGIRDDSLTVIAPIAGMPAEKAGIKAGDKIYFINGTSTAGMDLNQAVSLIRGPKGTSVKLSIFRKGFDKVQELTLVRAVITIKSVKTEMRPDGYYVITISAFNDDTISLFNAAIKDIQAKKPKGLIVDLRSNPGGYLDSAVALASEWIDKGPVVLEKHADGSQDSIASNGRGRLKDYKTVVLVDGGSASASEILAGALSDYGKAKLIGQKTYGKGSVQSVQNLPDGSVLKVTIAKWLTPKGTSINEQGITPDYKVDITPEDAKLNKDTQFNKALDVLKGLVAPAKTPVKAPVKSTTKK
jgi:carboxyl-terminal processing protease